MFLHKLEESNMLVKVPNQEIDFESQEFIMWQTNLELLMKSVKEKKNNDIPYAINKLLQSSLELNHAIKQKPYILNLKI
ncbi:MAG: hypothetical protein CVV28_12050 [Methanobacteriales archaeon HGW-Methanobacteriales-1]|jgi:hypothetical protein|nr:MAG: hypothetical protein CVV28_12050 [Methanobacteriales archaeon HGW-Methanobacteriales-1]